MDDQLRVVGHPNIFALGDVNNTPQAKLGFLADLQAQLAAKNLKSLASGSSKLAAWEAPLGKTGAMFVSLGPQAGTGHIGSCTCGSFFTSKMKSGNLFVDKIRSGFGV